MNYGELKTFFTELLNRNDITETQTDMFLSMGLRRTERTLRTSMQRRNFETTVVDPWVGYVSVPNDYLGLHYMKINGEMIRRQNDALVGTQTNGITDTFYIKNGKFYFQSDLNVGDEIDLCYYREFSETLDPEETTVFSAIIPDVIAYAALIYACDHFTDLRKPNFEATFGTLLVEVQSLSDRDELSGGQVVANPYAGMI